MPRMTPSQPPPHPPKAPPPLPSGRGPAPSRTSSALKRDGSGRPSRGRGLYWLLGVVLLFVAVKVWGAYYQGAPRSESVQEHMRQIWIRDRAQQARAARKRAAMMRKQLEIANRTDKIRRAPWAPLSDEQEAAARESGLPVQFENALGMRFVLIPAGTFIMGSPGYEEGRGDDEDLHNVVLSEPFYMLTTEVSISLFSRFDEDAQKKGGQGLSRPNMRARPIMQVSYETASAFCRWLEERDVERRYALPTEAQWEYACRGGTNSRFWWGEDAALASAFANVADLALRGSLSSEVRRALEDQDGWVWFEVDDRAAAAAPVGGYRANPWGLYDMLGNALEWCTDWYGRYTLDEPADPLGPGGGQRHVLRGGSSSSSLSETRCASRAGTWGSEGGDLHVGFRVVSTPRR